MKKVELLKNMAVADKRFTKVFNARNIAFLYILEHGYTNDFMAFYRDYQQSAGDSYMDVLKKALVDTDATDLKTCMDLLKLII